MQPTPVQGGALETAKQSRIIILQDCFMSECCGFSSVACIHVH